MLAPCRPPPQLVEKRLRQSRASDMIIEKLDLYALLRFPTNALSSLLPSTSLRTM